MTTSKNTRQLHDLGQSLWLDNITRDLAGERHARPVHRRAVRHGADLEPHDLRPRHRQERRVRRLHPEERPARRPRRSSSTWRSKISPEPPISFDPSGTARRASTAGRPSKCRRCWPTTPRAPSPPRRVCTRAAAVPTSTSRFPALRRVCPPSRRRSTRASRSTSRSSSRASSTSPRPKRTCAASSVASRPGSIPPCTPWRLSSSAGGTWRSRGRSPSELAGKLGIAIGDAHVQGVPGAARFAALAGSVQLRRAPAAAALGEHRDQGPQGVGRALHRGSRRAAHGEHDARGHAEGLRRPRPRSRAHAGRRRRLRRGARPIREGRHRRRRPGLATSGRGRQVVRQVLERFSCP